MKYRAFKLAGLFCAVLLFSAAISNGQSDPVLLVKIPFDFIVGDTNLPAGNYRIITTSPRLMSLQNYDNTRVAGIWTFIFDGPRKSKVDSSHLVFNRFGSEYFLSQIYCSFWGSNTAKILMPAVRERELLASAEKVEKVRLVNGAK